MHDAIFIFNFINKKTAVYMCNLFFNRTERYTHTNNYIGKGHILFDISFANKSKQTQIFDLANRHYRCLQHVQIEKSFVACFSALIWFVNTYIIEKKKKATL